MAGVPTDRLDDAPLDSAPARPIAVAIAIGVLCVCIAAATVLTRNVVAGVGRSACELHEAREGSQYGNWVPGSVADVRRLASEKGLRVTIRPDDQVRTLPGTVTKVSDCAPAGADVVLYVDDDHVFGPAYDYIDLPRDQWPENRRR